ncbi:hypothetical protein [Bradyrhizobium sp. USDA 3256]
MAAGLARLIFPTRPKCFNAKRARANLLGRNLNSVDGRGVRRECPDESHIDCEGRRPGAFLRSLSAIFNKPFSVQPRYLGASELLLERLQYRRFGSAWWAADVAHVLNVQINDVAEGLRFYGSARFG